MQTRYHLKEFRERNLILRIVIKFCLLKGALVHWEVFQIFAYLSCKKSLVSNETVMSSDKNLQVEYEKICSL